PPGYYLVSSLVTFWPGSLAAFVAVGIAFHSDKNFGERFCLAWLVPAWIVAELIPTKLPHYVLPMFPSLALLTANAALSPEVDWKRLMHSWLGRTCQVAWAVVTILIAAALLAGPILLGESASPLSALPGLAVLAILVAGIAWIQRGRIVPAMWVSVAGTVAIYPLVFAIVLPQLRVLWISEQLREAITKDFGATSRPLIAVGYSEPSLVFLINRPVAILNRKGASRLLSTHRDAIILAVDAEAAAIERDAAFQGIALREVSSFTGFDYTRGRMIRFALLDCENLER